MVKVYMLSLQLIFLEYYNRIIITFKVIMFFFYISHFVKMFNLNAYKI